MSSTTCTAGKKVNSNITNSLNVYYQNTRGLRSKTVDFFNAISMIDFKVIALTETWLNDSVFNGELFPEDYSVYRADRNL